MSSTNIKNISITCNTLNKDADNSYSPVLGLSNIDNFRAIALKSISFRNIFYNVESSDLKRKNNIFYFSLAGAPQQVVIPEGFYSINQLLTLLNTDISAILAGSGIIPLPTLDDLSYDSITGKVSITINGQGSATPFVLEGGTETQSVNNLLGQTTDYSLDTLTPTAYVFADLVSLGGIDRVHLVSSTLGQAVGITSTTNNTSNGKNISLIRVLTNNVEFGGLVEYISPDLDAERLLYNNAINISSLNLSLQDVNGNILDLKNSEMIVEFVGWL